MGGRGRNVRGPSVHPRRRARDARRRLQGRAGRAALRDGRGDRARLVGVNTIGLERRGFARRSSRHSSASFRTLFYSKLLRDDAISKVLESDGAIPEVRRLVEFIRAPSAAWSAATVTKLGLIAGNGVFPLVVATAARRRGYAVVAVAHRNETDERLAAICDQITWIDVGELQTMIDTFKRAGVTEAAMAGGISRARLVESFAPDERALAMLARVGRFSDDAVLRAIAAEMESDGIAVIDPVPMLDDALAAHGRMAGPEPTAAQLKDLRLAFGVMRALGSFDVGQAVAVRDGVVAAIEAVEGTDAAMRRAAALCGRGLVVVKAAKPGQDLRFDRPAIGPATIELLSEIGAAMIGVEAGQAMILERARTLAAADSAGLRFGARRRTGGERSSG